MFLKLHKRMDPFFYVSGKRKTKLVVRTKNDKKTTDQPTNQPKPTNQNQINQPLPASPTAATWKLDGNFQADAATALADAQRLCRVFFFNGLPPKGVGGGWV